MGYTIFITEKPSVAQEYRKVLDVKSNSKTDGYIEGYSSTLSKNVIITWAVGHLVSLCLPEKQNENWKVDSWNDLIKILPLIPNVYKYEPQASTYKQFKVVKELYTRKDIEAIYYAGDSGREGIYIQALIRNQIFKKAPSFTEKVVWIDSFTEEAILNGIKNAKPYASYQHMIDSGYARAISDWLIGMNFSPAFSVTSHSTISVGRVMTPTLDMLLQRQLEIENFVATSYYGINANLDYNNKDLQIAKWKTNDSDDAKLYSDIGFSKKEDADNLLNLLLNDKSLKVQSVDKKEKTEYAPLLFNLADLQNHCSKTYHINPSQTLEIVQSLYEKKLTTYPRTDARVLSSAVANDIKAKLGKIVPKKYVDDSKITDHYAIIPTFVSPSGLSELEDKVYRDILTRFNAIFEKPYIYETVTIKYEHNTGEHFYSSVKVVKQVGYKSLYGENISDNVDIDKVCKVGMIVKVNDFILNEMTTTPPPYFTTGSIIMAMEKAGKLVEDEELREQIKTCGIGTSATRAGIIEKLKNKKYIDIAKNQRITVTAYGRQITPLISKYDKQLVSPEKTAMLEQKLNDIAEGKLSLDDFKKYIYSYIIDVTNNVVNNNTDTITNSNSSKKGKSISYTCPRCGKELKYGKYGYYCDKNNDGCGLSIPNDYWGTKLTEADQEKLILKGETNSKKFFSKAHKPYYAKLVLNKDTWKLEKEFINKNN